MIKRTAFKAFIHVSLAMLIAVAVKNKKLDVST
jgi:hypothetical protein